MSDAKRDDDEKDEEPVDDGQDERAREAYGRSAPSGAVVYRAVLAEGDEELERPSSALFWSGLAAGGSMGFSLVAEALLRGHLPADAEWRPLVAKLGYSVGFLIVILGRQQLFTENTLTPVLPLLLRKDAKTFANVLRLWAVVFVANLLGALVVSLAMTHTPAFEPRARAAMLEIAHAAMEHGFGTVLVKGIFAGWLIALIVWLLPFAESARFFVIVVITYVVGLAGLSHIVAGSVDVFTLAWAGQKPWLTVLGGFILPALIGNMLGGITLVAALNHAQVVAGKEDAHIEPGEATKAS